MKTCVKCGSMEFSPRGDCRPCKRAYDKAYRLANKERIAQIKKSCYESNKEHYLSRQKVYFEQHKDKLSLASKEYRLKNRETILEKKKQYRDSNREKIKQSEKLYYEANKQKVLDRGKEYIKRNYAVIKQRVKSRYKANAESIKKKSQQWYLSNKDRAAHRSAQYYRSHPEVFHNSRVKRRASEAGGTLSAGLIELLIAEQNGKCPGCLNDLSSDMHLDHVTPLSKGGTHTNDNIQLLCKTCNLKKHAKHPLEWYKTLEPNNLI